MVGLVGRRLVGEMRVMDPLLRVRGVVWIMRITFFDWDREQSFFGVSSEGVGGSN